MLKKIIVVIVTTLCLSSCATILNDSHYTLKVISFEDNDKALINDSLYNLPAEVTVERAKKDLHIKLISEKDSLTKNFTAHALPSPNFLYGNLVFNYLAPVGYIADLQTPKRFYYGNRLFVDIDSSDTIIKPSIGKSFKYYFSRHYDFKKGDWAVTLSIPYINNFIQRPEGYPVKNASGFFGIAAAAEYYYKDNTFIKAKAAYAVDFPFFVPAPYDNFDAYEALRSSTYTLTHNHNINRFRFGYGINYAIHAWSFVPGDNTPIEEHQFIKRTSQSVGLACDAYLRVSDKWMLGMVYNPTFYNISPSGQFYQHTLSFDIAYIMHISKKGK